MDLVQYRDSWLGEKFDEFVGFYPREFYFLDNFCLLGSFSKEIDTPLLNMLISLYASQE